MAEQVDNGRKDMAPVGWEGLRPQASGSCPAGRVPFLPQGGWCGRARRGPGTAWSSSWGNKALWRGLRSRASHAWAPSLKPQSPHL